VTPTTTEVRYLIWVKVALVIGYPLIVIVTGVVAYMAVTVSDNTPSGWAVAAGFWIVVVLLVRSLLIAWPLLRFLDVRILIARSGLVVTSRGIERTVSWEEVGRVRNSTTVQVLDIYLRDGTRLVAVDWCISGFKELQGALQANTGHASRSLAT
jgi:hypothetical protein